MAEGLLGMMSESSGREGTLRLMYYGARRGLVECCRQAMIESCVFVAPDMNELYKRGACQNVRARERVCLKTLSLCGHDISCHQHSVHA